VHELLGLLTLPLALLPPHPRRSIRLLLLLALLPALLLVRLPKLALLLLVGALRVPLPGLQHQHADQHEGQDGVAGREHLEIVLAAEDAGAGVAVVGAEVDLVVAVEVADDLVEPLAVLADGDDAQALDDVGDVDDDAGHVEDERAAVEQHVGLGRLVQLHDQAEQAEEDHDVQDARDEGRRGVQEAQVRLQRYPVRVGRGEGGPEDGVIVGEEGEEDPEEEGRCWGRVSRFGFAFDLLGLDWCHLRQTMRKVAKEKEGMVVDWWSSKLC
jgi:hypothetical protein